MPPVHPTELLLNVAAVTLPTSPTAMSFSENDDEQMVMLLLPGGKGWEAQGSYSGVQKRALRSAEKNGQGH